MIVNTVLLLLILFLIKKCWSIFTFQIRKKKRKEYYNNIYLKSPEWRKKRFVVLKRDNFKCVYCGKKANQVHHKKYSRSIGKEPIKWLVSLCNSCHKKQHT